MNRSSTTYSTVNKLRHLQANLDKLDRAFCHLHAEALARIDDAATAAYWRAVERDFDSLTMGVVELLDELEPSPAFDGDDDGDCDEIQ